MKPPSFCPASPLLNSNCDFDLTNRCDAEHCRLPYSYSQHRRNNRIGLVVKCCLRRIFSHCQLQYFRDSAAGARKSVWKAKHLGT
jgi:hypothetical protein